MPRNMFDRGVKVSLIDLKKYFANKYEKRLIRELLRANQGNVTASALEALMDRGMFYRAIRKHGIDPNQYRKGVSHGKPS